MKLTKTYKFKLYNQKQTKYLDRMIDICGEIYNHCIRECKLYYQFEGRLLNKFALTNQIAKLKKQEKFKHWNLVPSQAIQDIPSRIDKSYKLFFRNLKAGVKTSPPKFKKVKKYSSFTTFQCGFKLFEDIGKIKIAKKVFPYYQSRLVKGKIKCLTVKRTILGYYIYLITEQEIALPNIKLRSGNSVGFDFGFKEILNDPFSRTFLISSNKKDINIPLFLRQKLMQLSLIQSKYSRKRKSKNTRRKLNRFHEKIKNQRRDMHFKLAHKLTDLCDYLFFETLDLKDMFEECQKTINDYGFYSFLQILKYIAKIKGKVVHQIDKWFPSSKMCSKCRSIKDDLKLDDREYICESCGVVTDRDLNASINILREGASSFGLKFQESHVL